MILRKRPFVGVAVAALALVGVVGSASVGDDQAQAAPSERASGKQPSGEGAVNGPGVEVKRGRATPDARAAALMEPPRNITAGQDAASESFAEALVWSLSSEASVQDPEFVPEALGGLLNTADAAMLIGFDREEEVSLDLGQAVYRVLGYAGDSDNPTQVMVEVALPLQMGDEVQQLVAGGVMIRTREGWLPTSMRPREVDATPQRVTEGEVLANVESGELGLGWKSFTAGGAE